ncbi:MAG: GIY-YIG nuclease family protein [Bacteroidetes bacterium]|nr:GIY-YIG nuclease family protein [Bacteroidota bacterium]
MQEKFAIVDIETNGLSAGQGRITEIAILVYDGIEVVDEFTSLVNPEAPIPYFITRLTGINNQMVAGAPKFYEIARRVVELTEGCTIVGHNVKFDYGFLRAEFRSLGYDYHRKTLDTVALTRKLMPGMPGYSLGKLCNALQINNSGRHRAWGDAAATLELFKKLLTIDPQLLTPGEYRNSQGKNLNINTLPERTGVYQFYDASGKLIYVGKSVNIRSRVMQHLSNTGTRKAIEMKNSIDSVSCELTGSELIALLLESDLIKKHQPLYNRRQRRALFNYGLYHYTDDQGYICLKASKTINGLVPDYSYASLQEANGHLFQLTERYQLCQKLNGLYTSRGSCFHYHIGQCFGACIGKEEAESYNARVMQALERFHPDHHSFFLILPGRSEEELGLVRMANGVYMGFGFIPSDAYSESPEVLDDYIKRYPDNRDVRQIILSYLRNSNNYKILPVQEAGL